MFLREFELAGGLADEQIDLLHEEALNLVEETGIQIPHDGILKLLSNYDGVSIEKGNVRFRRDLALEALKKARYDVPSYADWLIDAGAHQTMYCDLDSRRVRPSTLQDLIDMTKLGEVLHTAGSAPVVPLDLPVHLQIIMMHKVSYEYSRYRCNDIYEHMDKPTPACADYVYEMAQAAGKRFTFGIWMISPRFFDRNGLEIAYHLLDRGIPMWVSTMPVAGVSAPITMQAALLQSMFEHFAGLTMLSLINTKSYNYIAPDDAFEADPFDMKYSTFVYGSAEYTRTTPYKLALCRRYGIPLVAKSLNPAGKMPDGQACFENGVHTLIAALAGARVFRTGGLLSAGEIYSGEILVMACEMIEYIRNLLRQSEFSPKTLMVDEIKAVGPGQSYIGRRSTLESFRKEYWQPELFTHSNFGQWSDMGSKSTWDCANDLVKKRIGEHDYALDPQIKKELDKIYERAKNDQHLEDSFKVVS